MGPQYTLSVLYVYGGVLISEDSLTNVYNVMSMCGTSNGTEQWCMASVLQGCHLIEVSLLQ